MLPKATCTLLDSEFESALIFDATKLCMNEVILYTPSFRSDIDNTRNSYIFFSNIKSAPVYIVVADNFHNQTMENYT